MKTLRMLLLLALSTTLSPLSAQAAISLDEARRLYSEAMEQISRGRISEAERLAPQLQDYALYPYLELELIKAQIGRLSSETIDAYLQQYGNTIVGQRIRIAWVERMMRDRNWQGFERYYQGHGGTEMQCVHIRVLRELGKQREAVDKASQLWKTGRSLPDICDASLKFWDDSLSANERRDQYWLRAELAMENGEYSLAQYLLRRISADDIYLKMLGSPELLYRRGESLPVNDHSRIIATHALLRLAKLDYDRSNELWHQLDRHLQFNQAQNYVLRDALARQIIAGDASYSRDWVRANDPDYEDPYLTAWRIRLALKDEDWKEVQRLITHLPQELRDKADWQYWWARADIALNGEVSVATQLLLQKLAAERGYYSFLAADILNEDYKLDASRTLDRSLIDEVEQRGAVQRAKELQWHNPTSYSARLEWANAMTTLSRDEQVAAAALAMQWGWTNQAIVTAIRAGEWDDLTLRFPTPYEAIFQKAAKDEKLDLKWIYAIARQESAFAPDARSPVGARGLMQLMPGTARLLARQMGISVSPDDLQKPEKNVAMGSFYLARLLEQFNGNRILATAAYNAGPNRVERVLLRQERDYPADIWIENLPYGETREYIKNVLAFSIIYGKKLDIPRPMLANHERSIGPANVSATARN